MLAWGELVGEIEREWLKNSVLAKTLGGQPADWAWQSHEIARDLAYDVPQDLKLSEAYYNFGFPIGESIALEVMSGVSQPLNQSLTFTYGVMKPSTKIRRAVFVSCYQLACPLVRQPRIFLLVFLNLKEQLQWLSLAPRRSAARLTLIEKTKGEYRCEQFAITRAVWI